MSSEKLRVPIAITTLRASLMNLHHHVHRRQWTELIDRSTISIPESLTEAFFRIRKNVYYFRINYIIVLTLVLAVFLLSRPLSLLLLISLAGAWLFLYILQAPEKKLVILDRVFSKNELLVVLIVATVVVVVMTSIVSVIVYAVMVGVGIVCAHGAICVPEDLFLEQQEPWSWYFGLFPLVENGSKSRSSYDPNYDPNNSIV